MEEKTTETANKNKKNEVGNGPDIDLIGGLSEEILKNNEEKTGSTIVGLVPIDDGANKKQESGIRKQKSEDSHLTNSQILGIATEKGIEEEEKKISDTEETEIMLKDILKKTLPEKTTLHLDTDIRLKPKNDSQLTQSLHILTSIIVGIMLILATVFLEEGKVKKQWGDLPDFILSNEDTEITLLSDESFFVPHKQAIFGGEGVTVHRGEAEVKFFDGSLIRLQEGAKIKIEQIKPYPVIRHVEGDIWVFSQQLIQLEYENAEFYSRNSSTQFSRIGEQVRISAYRHPVFGEVWSDMKTAEKVSVAIPPGKSIRFGMKNLPSTLSGLHYSKLKKELRLTDAIENDWAAENIVSDKREINTQYEKQSIQKKRRLGSDGLLASIKDALTFYPSREKRNTEKEAEERRMAFFDEYVFGTNIYGISISTVSRETLSTALSLISIVPPNGRALKNMSQIIDEIKRRKDIEHSDISIAESLLSLLEDSLKAKDSAFAGNILAEIVQNWTSTKETKENKRMLEMYREIIADLMRKNMNQITSEIFASATSLDQLALKWEKEEKAVVAFEITQRNLETAESFLLKGEFKKAEEVLSVNDTLLEIRPSAKLITAYRDIKNKQSLLKAKNDIFQKRGIMSDEKFHAVLKDRKQAEETIKNIQKTQEVFINQQGIGTEEKDVNDEKSLSEKLREDFSEQGIIIISVIGTEDEKAEGVEIAEASLSDGTSFSAEYLPDQKVIRNIQISSEKLVISGEILLKDINIAIETIRLKRSGGKSETLEEVTKELAETWQVIEDDPLQGIDPLVIDVNKRLMMAELANRGFSAELINISMISQSMLHVASATLEDTGGGEAVSFDFDTKKKRISNVMLSPSGTEVFAQTLDDLEKRTIEAITLYMEESEIKKDIEWMLVSAGADTKNSNIDVSQTKVHFQNVKYHDWTISGIADSEEKIFTTILRDNLPLAKDIAFADLKATLQEKWGIYAK